MKILSVIIFLLIFSTLNVRGQEGDLSRNRIEVNGFYNHAGYLNKTETWDAFGLSVGYTRYLTERLNIGFNFGAGNLNGSGSTFFDEFEDDFKKRINNFQFQTGLGYDIIQMENLIVGIKAVYINNRFQQLQRYSKFSLVDVDGTILDERINKSHGVTSLPNFGIAMNMLNRISGNTYIKTEVLYCDPIVYGQYIVNFSTGLAFYF